MPPKKVEEKPLPTPEEIAKIAEDEAIRENWELYKSGCRTARDKREDSPNMKSFARAASEDPRVSKNEDAVYSQFKRASKNQEDVIGIMGRPSKGVDKLQLHAFARQASQNVWLRFIVCGTQSLKLIQCCRLKNLKVASRRVVWLFSTNMLQLNRAIPEKSYSPAPLSKTSSENSKRRSHS
jgi:hypothetical protein